MSDGDKYTWGADALLSQCMLCKHAVAGIAGRVCAAFPAAIPDAIRSNDYDHRRPWIDPATGEPGDRGVALAGSITFEEAAGINPVTLERLYDHLDTL